MSLTPPQGRSWVIGGHSTSSGAWSDMVRVRLQGERERRETRAESCACSLVQVATLRRLLVSSLYATRDGDEHLAVEPRIRARLVLLPPRRLVPVLCLVLPRPSAAQVARPAADKVPQSPKGAHSPRPRRVPQGDHPRVGRLWPPRQRGSPPLGQAPRGRRGRSQARLEAHQGQQGVRTMYHPL